MRTMDASFKFDKTTRTMSLVGADGQTIKSVQIPEPKRRTILTLDMRQIAKIRADLARYARTNGINIV